MADSLKVALAQLNPKVGDVSGNLAKVRAARAEAKKQGAELVLTSELVLSGYPPEDLVLKPAFQKRCHEAVEALRADTLDGGPALFVTTPWREGDKLHNAIICLDKGEVIGKRYKVDLPNYGVFDEKRVFAPGPMPGPLVFKGVRIGVPICEDVWTADVVECISETGGEILLVPNGSPYEVGKTDVRVQLGVNRVVESGLPFVYVNQVGGQDELIFDGGSFVLGADRALKAKLASFREEVATVEFRRGGPGAVGMGMPAGRHRARAQRHRIDLPGDDAGPARLCEQDRLSLGVDRPVGRRQLGADGGRRRRCAGAKARAHADDALALHQRALARGCQGLRRGDRRPLRHRQHRACHGSRSARCCCRCSAIARRTSPRRTSRAAPAASR